VIDYLDDMGDVGTIDEPKRYFRGELSMSWGILDERTELLGGPKATEFFQSVVYFG
jgi:hypothetical protein